MKRSAKKNPTTRFVVLKMEPSIYLKLKAVARKDKRSVPGFLLKFIEGIVSDED